MKNIKTIVLSLTLLGAFTLCEQEAEQVTFASNSIVEKAKKAGKALGDIAVTVQTKSKELVGAAQTAGTYTDAGLMAFPYYIGSFFGGAASTVKTAAGYCLTLPFRMVGNGIDGLFGQGTVGKMGSLTKGGLTVGFTGIAAWYTYKGLNGLAKKIAFSGIKQAFEKGGSKNKIDNMTPLEYNNQEHKNPSDFYRTLAEDLKQRFEATDVYTYIKQYAQDFTNVNTVFDELDENVELSLKADEGNTIESIVSKARENATGGFYGLGKMHLLNGYCKEALELYAKILMAQRIAKAKPNLQHQEIYELIQKNSISKSLLN